MKQPMHRSDAEVLARIATALSDPARVQLAALLLDGESQPIHLQALLHASGSKLGQPTVSHHLGRLVAVGLAESQQAGKGHVYRLTPWGRQRVASFLGRGR